MPTMNVNTLCRVWRANSTKTFKSIFDDLSMCYYFIEIKIRLQGKKAKEYDDLKYTQTCMERTIHLNLLMMKVINLIGKFWDQV